MASTYFNLPVFTAPDVEASLDRIQQILADMPDGTQLIRVDLDTSEWDAVNHEMKG